MWKRNSGDLEDQRRSLPRRVTPFRQRTSSSTRQVQLGLDVANLNQRGSGLRHPHTSQYPGLSDLGTVTKYQSRLHQHFRNPPSFPTGLSILTAIIATLSSPPFPRSLRRLHFFDSCDTPTRFDVRERLQYLFAKSLSRTELGTLDSPLFTTFFVGHCVGKTFPTGHFPQSFRVCLARS